MKLDKGSWLWRVLPITYLIIALLSFLGFLCLGKCIMKCLSLSFLRCFLHVMM